MKDPGNDRVEMVAPVKLSLVFCRVIELVFSKRSPT